jgi:hypothetical protein
MRTIISLGVALAATSLAVPAFAQEGLHYFAVEDLERGTFVQRGTAGGNGFIFNNLILAPNTRYRFWVLRSTDLEFGYVIASTGRAGTRLSIPPVVLRAPNVFDTDRDGLPDLAESIVGTAQNTPDTDADGVADGAEVRAGTDPSDGLITRTGIIASADTPGFAVDVCATDNAAAVADSNEGVTVFNVFNRMNPRAIAQVDTPGTARRVACGVGRVVVADGSGLAVIDISDPPAARVVRYVDGATFGGNVDAVTLVGNTAFVGLGTNEVVSIDLATGTILERLSLDNPVVDLAVEGVTLYALTRSRLHVIPLGQRTLAASGSAAVAASPLRLVVGGGIAYVILQRNYSTFNVANPASPVQIASTATQQFWLHLALNGSGLGVAAVGPNSPIEDQAFDVSVYDTSSPTVTNRVLGSFSTPGAARAVAIFNGLAYVADTRSGMHVVNYRSADTAGRAPTISLGGTIDFTRSPIQAEEGKLHVIRANVSDDVQVRNVEFEIDGRRVIVDGSFPFELQLVTPRLADQTRMTVRARVSDTGGNSAVTQEYTVQITPDSTPPMVHRVIPLAGSVLRRVDLIAAFVSEPLNILSLVPANFSLIEAGPNGTLGDSDDVPVMGGTVEFREDVVGLFRTFSAPLATGLYRATVTSGIRDRASNPISPEVTWQFRVFDATTDTDRDGVPDALEASLGLSPNDSDSDNDGINDGQEDFDRDGLVNALEVVLNTDARNVDSDGDGVSDGMEDQDRDSLTDGAEVLAGTNLFNPDTDGDQFLDGDEVRERSNPRDPLSTPLRFAYSVVSAQNAVGPPGSFATSVASVRNDENSGRPTSAVSSASVRNDAAHQSVSGSAEGRAFSVRNQ